jgi:hypothetical protein
MYGGSSSGPGNYAYYNGFAAGCLSMKGKLDADDDYFSLVQ